MPTYSVQETTLNIRRDAILIDTNILVKAFLKGEENQAYIYYFLEESEHQLLIPAAVVVEAWGFIVGARKDWGGGYRLMAWLNTPGRAAVIIPQQGRFDRESMLINGLRGIDCVDAVIYQLAHDISVECNLDPALPVATYDTKDFYKLTAYAPSLQIRLYDDLPI